MSLAIDVDDVTAVLLADGWHEIARLEDSEIASFDVDAYEFVMGHRLLVADVGAGFEFIDAGTGARMCGPLSSVLAVRRSWPSQRTGAR